MSSDGNNKKQFWKRSTSKVPGSDAWDVGDDDDELLAMAAHNLNIEVVMETANKEDEEEEAQEEEEEEEGAQEQATAEEDDDEEEEEAGSYRGEEEEEEEEEAATPETPEPGSQGDIRLVKSHSEAPIGSPRDEAGERVALHRQRSLPPRPPVIPMVARIADQNTTGTLVMTEREASRLDNSEEEGGGGGGGGGERWMRRRREREVEEDMGGGEVAQD
ncbi:hypothetical protein CRUP_021127, partial [Coryphaenoides rupestris]